jgi:hypothetical protein
MTKIPIVFVAGAIALLTACGDSDDSGDAQSTTTAASGGATTTAAAAAGSVPVALADRTLTTSSSLEAGSVTFAITNSSAQNQHELVVIKGKFDELPKTSNGAVDEAKLAAGALVGRSAKVAGGGTANVTVNLPAGPYVLLCNVSSGPTSHAALGQRLDVTAA